MGVFLDQIFRFLDSKAIKYQYFGKKTLEIKGFCSLDKLNDYSITWAKSSNRIDYSRVKQIEELLIVIDEKGFSGNENINILVCENSKRVFFNILTYFFKNDPVREICQDSVILTSDIGENVSIGHKCYLCEGVSLRDNVTLGNNVSIECPAQIGKNTVIRSGTVIGTDGFGYFQEEGHYQKVPHFGGVIIGEDVEIGANVCIDRGTINDTYIGDRVKIDNLCHIAHNVKIMEDSLVIAMSLVGGSSVLERESYIAPGAIIKNQVVVGKNSLIGMGAVVTKDVEANSVMAGVPAKKLRENL